MALAQGRYWRASLNKTGDGVALEILNGEQVPKQIVLGTRLFTQQNISDGGLAIN